MFLGVYQFSVHLQLNIEIQDSGNWIVYCLFVGYILSVLDDHDLLSLDQRQQLIIMRGDNSKNILERLDAGEVIIGDGSYCFTLEKRGYVKVITNKYNLSICSETK